MIKFFRGNRQDLLTENKWRKYLLYAIGEILLVVIGILIALSANNYSENQKALNQSNIYLHDMLEDLAADTAYLSRMISTLEKQLKNEEWLLNKDFFDEKDLDSIKLAVSNVNWTFNINDRSFLNIQNSPDAKLVGYEQLYSIISQYYLVTKNRIVQNNQREIQKASKTHAFDQVINRNLLITNRQYTDYSGIKVGIDFDTKSKEENFEKIITSLSEIETKNTLNEKYARHNYIYVGLFLCQAEAQKLIKLINRSLEKE